MRRLLIVSNRLPVSVSKKKGKIIFSQSAGGLATGIGSFYQSYESLWIGWPGLSTNVDYERAEIREKLSENKMFPVFLTRDQVEKYYEGFSNKTIWPLFHYFTEYTVYNDRLWNAYQRVNSIFCDELNKIARPDDIIWVHDYQLMLLPQMIRELFPDITIGFFLHIPFPSFEIFRTLPWRNIILDGILGSDLVGFHTYDYVRHFISSVVRLKGLEHSLGKFTINDRIIKIDSFPMGIDYDKFANASDQDDVQKNIENLKKETKDKKVIISIDRLDYSKAIPQRLKAFDLLLRENPDLRGKIKLVLSIVPSRLKLEHYKRLKIEIDELVGRINGNYGTFGWTPIWYLYRNFPFEMLTAMYSISDVALITPFRDGMNLIAKEFIACKKDGKGVLILSDMAGASDELGEAIMINPNDIRSIKEALVQALELAGKEQVKINKKMQQKLQRYGVKRWAKDFIETLLRTKHEQHHLLSKRIDAKIRKKIVSDYSKAKKRLIFLDYDGTLVPFSKDPCKAGPDDELLNILLTLSKTEENEVVVISGRDKNTLQKWLGHLNIAIVSEHGAWLRIKGSPWETIEPLEQEWKKGIRPIIESYVDKTPGSLIETKEFSLVWHYRKADPGLAEMRARELVDTLQILTRNLDLQILEGSKVVEVKNYGINKGKAASKWLNENDWDFIFAVGDDWTDEDLFRAIPSDGYSVKVGYTSSAATYCLKSSKEVRKLLTEFTKVKQL